MASQPNEVRAFGECATGTKSLVLTNGFCAQVTHGSRIRRVADKILVCVRDAGITTEAPIRAVLGNSADVSKALRWLLKCKEIERVQGFRGGKREAFRYRLAKQSY